jgi:hypothetical protein
MGYGLDAWLGLGPAPALVVVRSFPVWDRNEWQTESVCEAGALIDFDGKDLLVFLNASYGERLAALDGYRRTWPGWSIRWAYNGIADVTDALGLDRIVVEREPWDNTDLFPYGRADADEPLDLSYLVTVGDGAYGLDGWAARPWQLGRHLLDQLTGLPQPWTSREVPRGGLHLDPVARRVVVWSIDPVLGLSIGSPTGGRAGAGRRGRPDRVCGRIATKLPQPPTPRRRRVRPPRIRSLTRTPPATASHGRPIPPTGTLIADERAPQPSGLSHHEACPIKIRASTPMSLTR